MPACSALRSCIIASMQNVCTAPGKRSPAVFSPLITGIAIQFSANVGVDVEHPHRLFDRLFGGGVRGVAFLPEELGRAQEQARAHLPADDVGPLVDEERQVAIALHPARERVADDRLGGRPDDQRLFELAGGTQLAVRAGFQPVMRDDRAFLGEAFDVLGFLLQEATAG